MTGLAIVVAVAENGVIGSDGELPWKISDDLRWFKQVTLGKPVIMGRKTFESIGRPLPWRDNIVATRSATWSSPGVIAAPSIESAVDAARKSASASGAHEVCVIGGAEIYAQTLARADRVFLTRVEAESDGDVRFSDLDSSAWREIALGACGKTKKNEHSCRFYLYERRNMTLG